MKDIGNKLRKLRLDNNQTLEELAKVFKTSQATLSRYENGERKPPLEFIKSCVDYFKISADYFFSGNQTDSLKKEKDAEIEEKAPLSNDLYWRLYESLNLEDDPILDRVYIYHCGEVDKVVIREDYIEMIDYILTDPTIRSYFYLYYQLFIKHEAQKRVARKKTESEITDVPLPEIGEVSVKV